jgi:4-amino-4-deoxy-L-arabinose transferase-like glycosyltransferase
LLASQLIVNGKRPYLDFFFPQAPLNTYWNALWMAWLGQTWRVPHAVAAFLVTGALFLTVDYVYRRLPEPRWRTLAAVFVVFGMGLNFVVVTFGMVQAYGLCLFLTVVAWRATIVAMERTSLFWPCLAGFCSSAAGEATLLAAPIAPVLFIWMIVLNRAGSRVFKGLVFLFAVIVAWIPVFRLLAQSPKHVIFGILTYHMKFREVAWADWKMHNLEVALAWANSASGLLLIISAVAGFLYMRRSEWSRNMRAEIYLCGWLILAETLHIFNAHPTFSRYFLLITPFLSILAAIGLCAYGERITLTRRAVWPVAISCGIIVIGLAGSLTGAREDIRWKDREQIAAKVDEVTPPAGMLDADESIYFLTRRPPPPGMEAEDSHKIVQLKPEEAATLHLLSRTALDEMVKSGRFKTIQTCNEDIIERQQLDKLYANRANFADDCAVFWGWR